MGRSFEANTLQGKCIENPTQSITRTVHGFPVIRDLLLSMPNTATPNVFVRPVYARDF